VCKYLCYTYHARFVNIGVRKPFAHWQRVFYITEVSYELKARDMQLAVRNVAESGTV